MKRLRSLFCLLGVMMLCGCAGYDPPPVPPPLEEAPVSILILPPINNTTSSEAKEYYATTIEEILANRGYYVFPYRVTTDVLAMHGVYYTERLDLNDLSKFKQFFGADAVLISTIQSWNKSYVVLGATLTVAFDFEVKSTTTNQTLFANSKTITVDLTPQNTSGSLGGLLAQIIGTAILSASSDYWPYARQATLQSLSTIPPGPYWRQHQQMLTAPKAKEKATATP